MSSVLKDCLNKYQPYILNHYGSKVSIKYKMYLSCILSFHIWPVADVALALEHFLIGCNQKMVTVH